MNLPATIATPCDTELIIKRSQFLTHLAPVASTAEADAVIAAIRKQHWNANHNCVALVLGERGESARSSDDGEPSGTAGVPMLEVLRQRNMTDIVAVVTRYFGGIMLGAGGLVRAYSSAVSGALDVAPIMQRRYLTPAIIEVPHGNAGRIDNWLRDWAGSQNAVLEAPEYGVKARFTILVPPTARDAFTADIAAISAGAIMPAFGPNKIANLPANPNSAK
jgi:uncharacterized YigZ family protein